MCHHTSVSIFHTSFFRWEWVRLVGGAEKFFSLKAIEALGGRLQHPKCFVEGLGWKIVDFPSISALMWGTAPYFGNQRNLLWKNWFCNQEGYPQSVDALIHWNMPVPKSNALIFLDNWNKWLGRPSQPRKFKVITAFRNTIRVCLDLQQCFEAWGAIAN